MKTWINLQLIFALLGFLSIILMGYENYSIAQAGLLEDLAREKTRLNKVSEAINKKIQELDDRKLWKRYLTGKKLTEDTTSELQNYFPESIGLILNSENKQLLADTFTKQTGETINRNLFYQLDIALNMPYLFKRGRLYLYIPLNLNNAENAYAAIYSTKSGLYTSKPLPENSFAELLTKLEKSKYSTVEVKAIDLDSNYFNYFSVSLSDSDKILYLKSIPPFYQLKSFYAMFFFFFMVLYAAGRQQEYYIDTEELEPEPEKNSLNDEQAHKPSNNTETENKDQALEQKRQRVFNAELKQLITEVSNRDFEPEESQTTLEKYLQSEISYDLNPVLTSAIAQSDDQALFQIITKIRKKTNASAVAFLCFSPKLLSYSCYAQDGLTIFDEDNFFLNINDSFFKPSRSEIVKLEFDSKIKKDPFLRKRLLVETINATECCFFLPLYRFDVDGFLFFTFSDKAVSAQRIKDLVASQLFKDFLLVYRFSVKKKKFIKRENSASFLRRETQISLAECMGKLKITHYFLASSISVMTFRGYFKKMSSHLKTGEKFIMQTPDHLTILLDAQYGEVDERFPWLAKELDCDEIENLSYPDEGHVLLSYL